MKYYNTRIKVHTTLRKIKGLLNELLTCENTKRVEEKDNEFYFNTTSPTESLVKDFCDSKYITFFFEIYFYSETLESLLTLSEENGSIKASCQPERTEEIVDSFEMIIQYQEKRGEKQISPIFRTNSHVAEITTELFMKFIEKMDIKFPLH